MTILDFEKVRRKLRIGDSLLIRINNGADEFTARGELTDKSETELILDDGARIFHRDHIQSGEVVGEKITF